MDTPRSTLKFARSDPSNRALTASRPAPGPWAASQTFFFVSDASKHNEHGRRKTTLNRLPDFVHKTAGYTLLYAKRSNTTLFCIKDYPFLFNCRATEEEISPQSRTEKRPPRKELPHHPTIPHGPSRTEKAPRKDLPHQTSKSCRTQRPETRQLAADRWLCDCIRTTSK